MEFVKKFNQKHYKHYLNKANEYIGDNTSINRWVKMLNDGELIVWLCVISLFENENVEYNEEKSIMLTMLIRFFIIELDIEYESIKLKNSQIIGLVDKFKHMLYREYSNRYDIDKYSDEQYSLLK